MEVDQDGNADVETNTANSRRRLTHWAVDAQPATTRPTACKSCGTPFATNDVRVATFSSRNASRWCCLPCVTPRLASSDELTPVNRGTAEHVATVREAVAQAAEESAQATLDNTETVENGSAVHEKWETDALPDRAWWDNLSWSAALRLGSTTFVQVPDRFRGAVLTARRKAMQVLATALDSGGGCEAEWKFVLVFDALLLARCRTDTTCAELLEERLAWWWGGQWAALWYSAAGQPGTRTPPKSGTAKQKAARVHTLASSGEQGRALASVTAARLAPRTRETYNKLATCFPTALAPEAPTPRPPRTPPSPQLREAVESELRSLLRKPPKLSGPGLLGTRFEHLALCAEDEDTLDLLVKLVTKVAFAELPDSVLQALRTGELVALEKGSDDVRPLLLASSLRRLGLKALCRAKRHQLTEAAGENQYGVGRAGGASLLVKCLEAQAEARRTATFLKVDLAKAFQNLDREAAFRAMSAADAEVGSVLQTWYGEPATHLWRNEVGSFDEVLSSRGFDQGCPLAAAGFAIGQRGALDTFLAELQQLDPAARLYSYLDDTYVVVDAPLAALALAGLSKALEPLGLVLNVSKTAVWSPVGRAAVLPELQSSWVDTLPVLGAYLKTRGDADDAPHRLGQAASGLPEATRRLETLWGGLQSLLEAGLKRQAAGALLRTYAGAASQHSLQLSHAAEAETLQYDNALKAAWETLAGRTLDDTELQRLGLPAKLGGAGVQWAGGRRHAAYWAGWTALATEVRKDLRLDTLADLLDTLPATAARVRAARDGLAEQGAPVAEGAALSDALGSHSRQRAFLNVVQKKTHAALKQRLTTEEKAWLEGAGGPGAGAFLQYPEDANCSMEDELWSTALRQRLGVARAECREQQYPLAATTCHNKTSTGTTCACTLDDGGLHSATCKAGGGVMVRHFHLANATAGLLKRWTNQAPLLEQRVPTWDRPRRNPRSGEDPLERAVLDIEYTEQNERRWIDVTVRHPAAGTAADCARAGRKPGEAARRAERGKHERYPGSQLTAFAVELPGRLGGEARQWLKHQVQQLPEDTWTHELNRAYKVLSCTVQSFAARQLRKASGLR